MIDLMDGFKAGVMEGLVKEGEDWLGIGKDVEVGAKRGIQSGVTEFFTDPQKKQELLKHLADFGPDALKQITPYVNEYMEKELYPNMMKKIQPYLIGGAAMVGIPALMNMYQAFRGPRRMKMPRGVKSFQRQPYYTYEGY